MKKILISCALGAMMLFAANANADVVGTTDYDAVNGTISAEDGSWNITDLFGTAIAKGNYQYDYLDKAYWSLVGVDAVMKTAPPADEYFSWSGSPGVYTMTTTFELSELASGTFDMFFWNTSSTGIIAFELNGHELYSDLTGPDNEGIVTFVLDYMLKGENTLTFSVDTTSSGSNNIGVCFMAESTAPDATPEPATLILLGLGALGLPMARRFRNK